MTGDTASTAEHEAFLAAGRKFFARPCGFVMGVADLDQLPPPDLPEVAFAGRSNVGKSTLINALVNRKNLAYSSNTPGRTQEINYFELDGRLVLVDLPGHGFAKVPKEKVRAWQAMTNAFLKGRSNLRRVLLLIDARHGIKAVDREVMGMLDTAAVNYQAVLTKADKIKPGALERVTRATAEEMGSHTAAHPEVIATSAETGLGIDDLRAEVAAFALPEQRRTG